MGSYVMRDAALRAVVLPEGGHVILSYTYGHDKNTYPHENRWHLTHVGDVQSTLRHIGSTCASIEDGLTHISNGYCDNQGSKAALMYAQGMLAALAQPVPLAQLPPTTTLSSPYENLWMIARDKFGSREEMMAAYKATLQHWGVPPGSSIATTENIPLLLQLDRFSGPCHDAWPKSPQAATEKVSLPEAQPSPTVPAELPIEAVPVRDAPYRLFLMEHRDGTRALLDALSARKRFWTEVFPSIALQANWEDAFERFSAMLDGKGRAVDSWAITIGKPSDQAPECDRALWRSIYGLPRGLKSNEGSLAVLLDAMGSHYLGMRLLESCPVVGVDENATPTPEAIARRHAVAIYGHGLWNVFYSQAHKSHEQEDARSGAARLHDVYLALDDWEDPEECRLKLRMTVDVHAQTVVHMEEADPDGPCLSPEEEERGRRTIAQARLADAATAAGSGAQSLGSDDEIEGDTPSPSP